MNPTRILFASLIGTTIEFFDFYVYGTAAVLVFPQLFFPPGNPTAATLQSLATFGIAFVARPIGSAVFGHFGDRVGRKATLVAALLTMGLSTVAIGMLPTYGSIGVLAPALLALCRFGQGIGLGGEWGGAVLLATENAPPGKRSWYGMFPQLGSPLGFLCATGVFVALTPYSSDAQFFAWGWRVPFIASALLVVVGLWVRLKITETPEFERAVANRERVALPLVTVLREHIGTVALATAGAITVFVMFYLMTVFTLSWGTSELGFARQEFLIYQMIGVLFFAATIPISAVLADRVGRIPVLIATTLAILAYGLVLGRFFAVHDAPRIVDGARARARVHGAYVRAARHRPHRAVPDGRALHGRVHRVQHRGNLGRLAGAVHRDVARDEVWHRGRRLLPFDRGARSRSRRPSRSSRARGALRRNGAAVPDTP